MQDLRGDAELAVATTFYQGPQALTHHPHQPLGQREARPRLCAELPDGHTVGPLELAPPPRRSRQPSRSLRLEQLVESEILPRLLLSHPAAPPCRSADAAVEALLGALLAGDADLARAAFDRAAAAESESRLMLDVLAPVARKLGALWEEDACDFLDVSLALDRLHALLGGLKRRPPQRRRGAPEMLLLTAPGETHAFGADMAAEMFRREGWRVERGDADQLPRLAGRRFAALGVSCACARALDALPRFLAQARKLAQPQGAAIALGGALFLTNPSLACEFGADFTGSGPDAPRRITRALLEPAHM